MYHKYILKFWCKLCFFQAVFSKMQLLSLKDKSMIWWTIRPVTKAAGLNMRSNLENKRVLWINVVDQYFLYLRKCLQNKIFLNYIKCDEFSAVNVIKTDYIFRRNNSCKKSVFSEHMDYRLRKNCLQFSFSWRENNHQINPALLSNHYFVAKTIKEHFTRHEIGIC